jgi:hypothetical protein
MRTFAYGSSVLAYDPWRQSIWGVGHAHHQQIAEITIPSPVNGPLSSLPTAGLKTSWIDTAWRSRIRARTPLIGGILPQANGDLIVSVYDFYDNVNLPNSHFRRAADGTVTGPVRAFGNAPGGGFVAGYMGWIPQEWRQRVGHDAFTGQCCLSTINRTSFGPALSGFDPASIATQNPAPSTWLLGYPNTHPSLGRTSSPYSNGAALFNGSVANDFAGVVWIDGTSTLLAVQKMGTGAVIYRGGYSAGPNVLMVLAYDANDLVAVKNGRKQPWQVVPYAHWVLNFPLAALGIPGPLGVGTDEQSITYDSSTRRLFMSSHTGIPGGEHIVLVYRVQDAPTVAPPSAPPSSGKSGGASSASVPRARRAGSDVLGRAKARGSESAPENGESRGALDEPRPRAAEVAAVVSDRQADVRGYDVDRSQGAETTEPCADTPPLRVKGTDKLQACGPAEGERIRSLGIVRYQELAVGLGVWVIVGPGGTYEVSALGDAYQVDGLVVLFDGWLRDQERGAIEGSIRLDLRTIDAL